MSPEILISSLYVFALAAFLGYQVISRVPPLLHTPLMSATNAISAISVVGALVTAGADYGQVSKILGFIAVISAMINVVGGFMITDRMLRMFKEKPGGGSDKDKTGGGGSNHKGGGR
ncbi:MAG: NAD(P) transhydrogenase subunit alpha [Acidobacteria bacterium]|nr:NAD(P) transhydrogenase subunit alpha [Acidobacteriota bacterium]